MAEDLPFLSRWSRRKVESRDGAEPVPEQAAAPPPMPAEVEARPPEPLPPVESLTPESDFTPFLKPGVDEGLKRQALRTLFRDPQFNIQDGLDIYIGDYTQPDPIPPEMLARMNQMSHLGARDPEPDPNTATAKVALEASGENVSKPVAPAPPPAGPPAGPPAVAAADPLAAPHATEAMVAPLSAPVGEGENPSR